MSDAKDIWTDADGEPITFDSRNHVALEYPENSSKYIKVYEDDWQNIKSRIDRAFEDMRKG